MLKCGVSQVDITPYLGSHIPGQTYNRLSTGVKDPLYAKAVVFDDGQKQIASVVLDTIIINTEEVRKIREKAAAKCSVPASSIMVSAIHSTQAHLSGIFMKSKRDPAYLEFLTTRCRGRGGYGPQGNCKTSKWAQLTALRDTIAFNRRYPNERRYIPNQSASGKALCWIIL